MIIAVLGSADAAPAYVAAAEVIGLGTWDLNDPNIIKASDPIDAVEKAIESATSKFVRSR